MGYSIEVTNEELFNEKVNDVDTSMLQGSDRGAFAMGTLFIERADGSQINIIGEFGQNDYQEEYGFILV